MIWAFRSFASEINKSQSRLGGGLVTKNRTQIVKSSVSLFNNLFKSEILCLPAYLNRPFIGTLFAHRLCFRGDCTHNELALKNRCRPDSHHCCELFDF